MKRETAQLLADLAFDVSGKLDNAVATIQRSESREVFEQERQAIGRVMGALHFEILERIFREYPDVAPDWWTRR